MKSYQQIVGDGTTDRATHAPASPAHTPEPWNLERPFEEPGVYIAGPNTGLIAKLYEPDARLYNGDKLVSIDGNAARICATINACAGMTDPEAEIKALRDALIEASNALLWIAQEAEQRAGVPKAIIGGARHHAVKAKAIGGEAGK